MRAHHARAAKALDARVEPGGEFWGWAGRTLGAPALTAAGQSAWLRLVSAPEDKASGKLWDGALDAQHAFGDLDTEQLVRLVGGPVAEDRGEGYVPSELAPEPELRFEAIGLWRMARPRPFREECVRRVRAGAEPPAGPLARSVPDDGDDEPLRGPSALTHRSGTAAALIRPVREWGCRSRRRGRVCGCSGG
jgi:hypothetical protein